LEEAQLITHLAIRGFVGGEKQFEDRTEVTAENLHALLPALAAKHATALAEHRIHVIEIEFLDEPNPQERFFRFGTDPNGMVMPIGIKLEGGH
jgi:hypothetical protein